MVLDETAEITCYKMSTITPPANDAGNPSVPRLYRLGDLLEDFASDAAEAHEAYQTGTARGPVTGFKILDREISGALMPGLHVIHGGPGCGKTALALQIAACCGTPALFVSCEIAPLEIIRRMAARVTGTYLGRFKTGELAPAEAVTLARRACESAPLLALADGTAGFPDPAWILQQALVVKGDARNILLVVDSLHTWAARAEWGKTEYETLNLGLAELEKLAGALQAPLVTISERNRASMTGGGLNAGKGTSRIEYAGESVIGLNYADEKNKEADVNGEIALTMRIEKNRHGSKGKSLDILFHGAMQRFLEG